MGESEELEVSVGCQQKPTGTEAPGAGSKGLSQPAYAKVHLVSNELAEPNDLLTHTQGRDEAGVCAGIADDTRVCVYDDG